MQLGAIRKIKTYIKFKYAKTANKYTELTIIDVFINESSVSL